MSWVVGLSNNSCKPTTWVRARLCKLQKKCTRLAAASDKVYQLLAHGRWFSPGTPASSTTKTGCHDIAEKLLKVALNIINQIKITYNQCKVSTLMSNGVFFIHQSYTDLVLLTKYTCYETFTNSFICFIQKSMQNTNTFRYSHDVCDFMPFFLLDNIFHASHVFNYFY